jgi:hypothetical protein
MKYNTIKEQSESAQRILGLSSKEIARVTKEVGEVLQRPELNTELLEVYYNPIEEYYELLGVFTFAGELFWVRSTSGRITDPTLISEFIYEAWTCISSRRKWNDDYNFGGSVTIENLNPISSGTWTVAPEAIDNPGPNEAVNRTATAINADLLRLGAQIVASRGLLHDTHMLHDLAAETTQAENHDDHADDAIAAIDGPEESPTRIHVAYRRTMDEDMRFIRGHAERIRRERGEGV